MIAQQWGFRCHRIPSVQSFSLTRQRSPPSNAMPSGRNLFRLAETFRVLGDPTQVRILQAPFLSELCVATLPAFSAPPVGCFHQLRLRSMRVVKYRKAGRIVYYSLDDSHVGNLLRGGSAISSPPRRRGLVMIGKMSAQPLPGGAIGGFVDSVNIWMMGREWNQRHDWSHHESLRSQPLGSISGWSGAVFGCCCSCCPFCGKGFFCVDVF